MEPNGKLQEDNEKLAGELSRPSSPSPEQKKLQEKTTAVSEACKWKDIELLRTLATSEGGLVSDEGRRQACSCLRQKLTNRHLPWT